MAHLTPTELTALKRFKQRVAEALPGQVQSLQLFGSKARGDAAKHSDVDVLVVINDTSYENRLIISGIAFDVMMETGVFISTKKFTPAQINDLRAKRAVFWQSIEPDLVEL